MSADEMVEWLRVQLDEDERVARAAGGRNWGREAYGCVVDAADNGLIVYSEGTPDREQADHIARQDPSHVLGIVAAHRKLLDLVAVADDRAIHADAWTVGKEIVQTIAAGYRHRDGYRPEWAPQ